MCGLCGVVSTTLNATEIETFQHLMVVSSLRGYFGAGIVAVPMKEKNDIQIVRHADFTAAEVAYGRDFYDVRHNIAMTCLMGHARSPTTGGLDIENTHPHISGGIVGMHNGTLTEVAGQKIQPNDSDSKLLFQAIDTVGLDTALKSSSGSYSLTFLDTNTGTINFIRNEQRPLWFARIGSIETLYWASEAAFLKLVLSRQYPHSNIQIFALKPHHLLSFRMRPISSVSYVTKREIKPEEAKSNVVPLLPAPTSADLPMVETKPGYYVSSPVLHKLLMDGCCFCQQQSDEEDVKLGKVVWTGGEEYVCDECIKTDQFAKDYVLSLGYMIPTH